MSEQHEAVPEGESSTRVEVRRRRFRFGHMIMVVLFLLGSGIVGLPWLGMRLTTSRSVVSMADLARGTADVALVLGAGIRPDGSPTPVLAERVRTGAELFKRGVVRKLIMSGDNSRLGYDEVTAMKNFAVELGVPPNDVLRDYAGFKTMDSCVRLRKVFGQTRAVVVSQRFHLARALHLCRFAGVDALGVSAPDPRSAGGQLQSTVREIPASTLAWWSVHVFGAKPKFLGPRIDIDAPPPDALEQPRP